MAISSQALFEARVAMLEGLLPRPAAILFAEFEDKIAALEKVAPVPVDMPRTAREVFIHDLILKMQTVDMGTASVALERDRRAAAIKDAIKEYDLAASKAGA